MPLPLVSLNFFTAASSAPFCGSLVSACQSVMVNGPVMSRSASVVAAGPCDPEGAADQPQAAISIVIAKRTLNFRMGPFPPTFPATLRRADDPYVSYA